MSLERPEHSERNGLENRIELAIAIVWILNAGLGLSMLLLNTFVPIYNAIGFFFRFALRLGLWTLIVPLLIHLPNGDTDIWPYFESIKLTKIKPAKRNVAIIIVSLLLLFGGFTLGVIVYGDWVFDLSRVLPPESGMLLEAINPGLFEEIIWRGIILTLLLKKYSLRTSIAINTVLFALAHLVNLLAGQPLIVMLGQLVFVLIGTPFLALVFVKTNSLIPGIVIHYSIDAFQGLFIYTLILPGADLVSRGIFMLLGWFVGNILAISALMKLAGKDLKEDSSHIVG